VSSGIFCRVFTKYFTGVFYIKKQGLAKRMGVGGGKNFHSIALACRIARNFKLAGGALGIQAVLAAARRILSTQSFSK
jgi:hypothetical protein